LHAIPAPVIPSLAVESACVGTTHLAVDKFEAGRKVPEAHCDVQYRVHKPDHLPSLCQTFVQPASRIAALDVRRDKRSPKASAVSCCRNVTSAQTCFVRRPAKPYARQDVTTRKRASHLRCLTACPVLTRPGWTVAHSKLRTSLRVARISPQLGQQALRLLAAPKCVDVVFVAFYCCRCTYQVNEEEPAPELSPQFCPATPTNRGI